jgi:hypothetical protein
MMIERLQCRSFKGLTRSNGFELLERDFNLRWAMRSSVSAIFIHNYHVQNGFFAK